MSQTVRAASAAMVMILAASAAPALAYMGPGAGLSAIGSLFALIAAGIAALFGFVWFPVKRMLRRRKADAIEANASDAGTAAPR